MDTETKVEPKKSETTPDASGQFATYRDLVDATRGIRDEMRAMLAETKKWVETQCRSMMHEEVVAEVDKRLTQAEGTIESRIKGLEGIISGMTPEINVHVPPPRRLKKEIEYDSMGRPSSILEVDE